MACTIRRYSPADRERIRHICCETGFSGAPVDPVFSDRDVFADFFTRYYTDWEPESNLVVEDNGEVVGYLLGCRRYQFNAWITPLLMVLISLKVVWRFLLGRYNAQDRRFLRWCIQKGSSETPAAPKQSAHLHFNLLPQYRDSMQGYYLFIAFRDMVAESGVKRLYGQIQTFEDKRPIRVFERFGFKQYDQRQITKFQGLNDRKVFVTTIVLEVG